MELVIDARGQVRCIYAEAIDLAALGKLCIRRASYVEPDEQGFWWVNLRLPGTKMLGPFNLRTLAITAELELLRRYLFEKHLTLDI